MTQRFAPPTHRELMTARQQLSAVEECARDRSIYLLEPPTTDMCDPGLAMHVAVMQEGVDQVHGYPVIMTHLPFRLTHHQGDAVGDINIYRLPQILTEAGLRVAYELDQLPGIESVKITRYMAEVGLSGLLGREGAREMLLHVFSGSACPDLQIGQKTSVGFGGNR